MGRKNQGFGPGRVGPGRFFSDFSRNGPKRPWDYYLGVWEVQKGLFGGFGSGSVSVFPGPWTALGTGPGPGSYAPGLGGGEGPAPPGPTKII